MMDATHLRVHHRPDGKHEVRNAGGDVLAVCETNAAAWRWIDKHTLAGQEDTDRHYRIRASARFL